MSGSADEVVKDENVPVGGAAVKALIPPQSWAKSLGREVFQLIGRASA